MVKKMNIVSVVLMSSLAGLSSSRNQFSYFKNVRYRSLVSGADLLVRAPVLRSLDDSSCLVDGIHCILENNNIIDAFFSVYTADECQYTCANSGTNCAAFTWFGQEHPIFPNSCFLFKSCSKARNSYKATSGPATCACHSRSACQGVKGNFVKFKENIDTEGECQGLCLNNSRCKFYTWFGPENSLFSKYCFLFSSCEKSSCNCKGCFSGPPSCFKYTLEPDLTSIPSSSSISSQPSSPSSSTFSVPGEDFPKPSGFQVPQLTSSASGNPSLFLSQSSQSASFSPTSPSSAELGQYKNAIINYMPELKYLLVLIKNNKSLDQVK